MVTRIPGLAAATAVLTASLLAGAPPQNLTQNNNAFEVVSIKASRPSPVPIRVGGLDPSADRLGQAEGCPVASSQVEPRRFVAGRVTALRLIAWAYNIRDCRPELGLISGGPAWIRSDPFDIEAVIPEGTPPYSRQQLTNGEAPKLQAMLQTMLVDRFNLTVHRRTVEMRVFNLIVAKPGKIQPARDPGSADPSNSRGGAPSPPPGTLLLSNGVLQGRAIPMSLLMVLLQARLDNPLIDKTGLTGLFDITVSVEVERGMFVLPPDATPQVLNGLGLKLESGRAPVQVIAIDRVEKPTIN